MLGMDGELLYRIPALLIALNMIQNEHLHTENSGILAEFSKNFKLFETVLECYALTFD